MTVLASAANGGPVGSTEMVACLTWIEPTAVEVETCGRSYWSFLQRLRAIDARQLVNVSALKVDVGVEEEASVR